MRLCIYFILMHVLWVGSGGAHGMCVGVCCVGVRVREGVYVCVRVRE